MLTPAIFTPSVRRCLSISIYCGASATREPEDECRPLSVNYRKKTMTATHSRAFLLTGGGGSCAKPDQTTHSHVAKEA